MNINCDLCDEFATVHLTKIEHLKKKRMHLCEACAAQQGLLSVQGKFSVDEYLDAIEDEVVSSSSDTPCPICSMTYNTFQTTHRLGCPDCYEHFKRRLQPVLEKVHKSSQHVGKIPRRLSSMLDKERLIKDLKDEQKQAITDENYEKAAELRDRINLLEQELDALENESE